MKNPDYDLAKAAVGITKEQVRAALAKSSRAPEAGPPDAAIGRWLEEQKVEIVGRVNAYQVRVTPALAEAWLKYNTGNRKPSQAKIRRFAAAMVAGRWTLNGETVKFSAAGRLLDGQSRLLAIVKAGVAIALEVRGGLGDQAQDSMDCGELRKGAHTLEMMGEQYPSIMAAALKLAWRWELGALGGQRFGSSDVLENFGLKALIEKHGALRASIGWVVSDGHQIKRLMPQSEGAFFHYACGLGGNAKARDMFFEQLVEGIGLTKTSPAYVLRERLLSARTGIASRLEKRERYGLIIKAWNLHLAGAKAGVLALRLTGEKAEGFPELKGTAA